MTTSKTIAVSVCAIFLAVAFAPLATATHMHIYHVGEQHDMLGTWSEDGDVVPGDAPAGLAGIGERVRETPLSVAGQGGRVFNAITVVQPQIYFNLNHYAGTDFLWPGATGFMAWYGNWNDLNGDGVISDAAPDANGNPPSAEANDEFLWRGAEDGNGGLSMVGYIHPSDIEGTGILAGRPFLTGDPLEESFGAFATPSAAPDFAYADRTAPAEAGGQPFYVAGPGWSTQTTDESFLVTTTVLSVVDAQKAAGSEVGFDLADSASYRDVDVYESLDPTVESLYLSSARTAKPAYDSGVAAVNSTASAIEAIVDEYTEGLVPSEVSDQLDSAEEDSDKAIGATDDVLFGPVPNERAYDMAGNDYASGFAPWLDVTTRFSAPTLANVDARSVHGALFAGVYGNNPVTMSPLQKGDDRTQIPGIVQPIASTGLWFDANGDGWIGEACDVDERDAVTGECSNPYNHGQTDNPHDYGDTTEFVGLGSTLCTYSVTLDPMGEAWPAGTVIMRTYDRPTSEITAGRQAYEPVTGNGAVSLRFNRQCTDATGSSTQDALISPTGSFAFPIAVSLTVTLPPVTDTTQGITFPGATITDNDILTVDL